MPWILVNLHCWMIRTLLIPQQVHLSFRFIVCNQFVSLLLSLYSSWMCWFYCSSWITLLWITGSCLLYNVPCNTPVQANLNLFNPELYASPVVKAPQSPIMWYNLVFLRVKIKFNVVLLGLLHCSPFSVHQITFGWTSYAECSFNLYKKQVMNRSASVIFGLVRLVISQAKTPLV